MLVLCLLVLVAPWVLHVPVLGAPGSPLFLVVSRRQSEQIPPLSSLEGSESEPSCGELRAMWRHMRRMARHSQMSNEIPRLPYGKVMLTEPQEEFLGFPGDELSPSLGGPSSRRRSPSSPMQGRFLDRPLPVTALGGVFGTVVRSPEEKPRWRIDGTFGQFHEDKYGKVVQNNGDPLRTKEQNCRRWKGRPCRREGDCGGCGLLRCVAAKCRPSTSATKKVRDDWGTWSSSPYESSRLGLSRKRDPFDY